MTLGGLNGATAGRRVMFALPPAWFSGGILGSLILVGTTVPAYAAPVLAIALGVMVAADAQLPVKLLTGIIATLAGALGFITGTALATQSSSPQMLIGSAVALCVLATALPAVVVVITASAPWMRIAVRVSDSWIAGVGLLMLGWQLRSS